MQAIDQFQAVTNRSPNEANPWDSLGEGISRADARQSARGVLPGARHRSGVPAVDSRPGPRPGRAWTLRRSSRERVAGLQNPGVPVVAGWRDTARRWRFSTRGRRDGGDAEVNASALLTSAWFLLEQKQYVRALEEVRAAEKALADRARASVPGARGPDRRCCRDSCRRREERGVAPFASQKSHYDRDDRVESNWVAALEGEIALAARPARSGASSFKVTQEKAWHTLGRDSSTVFAINLPSRDGPARVEIARGNRAAAIEEYRRLTSVGAANRSSAVLEPRHILELARLLAALGEQDRRSGRIRAFPEVLGQCRCRPAGVQRSKASGDDPLDSETKN